MWYEILPSFAIITTCLALPTVVAWGAHKISQNGNPYRRHLSFDLNDLALYQRDIYNGKNAYVRRGLESIPDK